MVQVPPEIRIRLPQSIVSFNERYAGSVVEGVEQQMRLCIQSAVAHIQSPGCGPFWAMIVERETDRILCGAGNFVVGGKQSWMHGERLAFSLGQTVVNNFVFPYGRYRLVTTAAMCIACYGESLTSGIAEIVAAARGEDVERETPFKEGRLPQDWQGELKRRGILYRPDVLRDESLVPLRQYSTSGGISYFNAGPQT
ncbi:MAG: hypothetical protein KDD69_14510 [Bdellovibrionales bacterium]|nr:hypothetical protein [Bdellovibrionales bacterium]